jgi:hypothetical protein
VEAIFAKHSPLSGEGSNAKVFTPNWLKDNVMDKVGEGVKAKNEKWLTRAQCARMYASPPSESENRGSKKEGKGSTIGQ